AGIDGYLQHYTAPKATREQIARVHGERYIDEIVRASPATGLHFVDPDTALNPHTLEVAFHAACAVVKAVDLGVAGVCSAAFRTAVRDHWLPALEEHQPELIFVSAGFDAHREDPLANLKFVEADYGWVTREIAQVAAKYAEGRIVSSLEGGYALSALGRSVTEHVRELVAA